MLQKKWGRVWQMELAGYTRRVGRFVLDRHAERRCVWRCISGQKLVALVAQGEVIYRACGQSDGEAGRLLVLCWEGDRPLHVVICITMTGPWVIKTVYEPATRPWKWSRDLRKKLCWCGDDKDEEVD